MNRTVFRFAATAAMLMLAACGGKDTAQPPLAGAKIGGPFVLTDQDGKTVRDTDFAGKYRIVYFGYTYCPDICPIDVQNIGRAMQMLGKSDPKLAGKIVPIFITVDPERDNPAAVKQFVRAFSPNMVGLTGSPQAIAAVAKEYAIFYSKEKPSPAGGYLVNHGRQSYLMGPKGEPVALLPQDESPEAIVTEIKRWVS